MAAVIRESLKLGTQNHYLDGIPALFAGVPVLKNGMQENHTNLMSRAQLGLLLRNKFIHNPQIGICWSTAVLFSLVTELVPSYSLKDDNFHRECHFQNTFLHFHEVFRAEDASTVLARYNTFTERIFELGLQDDVDKKTILNVRAILHLTSSLMYVLQG